MTRMFKIQAILNRGAILSPKLSLNFFNIIFVYSFLAYNKLLQPSVSSLSLTMLCCKKSLPFFLLPFLLLFNHSLLCLIPLFLFLLFPSEFLQLKLKIKQENVSIYMIFSDAWWHLQHIKVCRHKSLFNSDTAVHCYHCSTMLGNTFLTMCL